MAARAEIASSPAPAAATPGAALPLRSGVRLRALVLIRWAAVAGQLFTAAAVHWGLGFTLPVLAVRAAAAPAALPLTTRRITLYGWRLAEEARQMADALGAAQAALAREQRLSALGALAAAAAHELGSPLSTIAVVTKEMLREVEPDDPLREDVELLSAESDRCRPILAPLSVDPAAAPAAPS